MNATESLLAAIRAAPDDDQPRLAFADHCDAGGDSDWAALIRQQCFAATLPRGSPHWRASVKACRAYLAAANTARWSRTLLVPAWSLASEWVRGLPTMFLASLDRWPDAERDAARSLVAWRGVRLVGVSGGWCPLIPHQWHRDPHNDPAPCPFGDRLIAVRELARQKISGPWEGEPPEVRFSRSARIGRRGMTVSCVLLRTADGGGAWAGYLGVPPDHPAFGISRTDASPPHGYNYAAASDCCRTDTPGHPDGRWYFGFDQMQGGSVRPVDFLIDRDMAAWFDGRPSDRNRYGYRTLAETIRLVEGRAQHLLSLAAGGFPMRSTTLEASS